MLLFCSHVSIASHKACYSHSSEVASSFTLQAYFHFFFANTLHVFYFPLLPSPCMFCSLFVFAGAALAVRAALRWHPNSTDQSCFAAALTLAKAGEVSQMSDQMDVKKSPCYRVTGAFTSHRFIKDASMVSGVRNRQQCDKPQTCPTGCRVYPRFPIGAAVSRLAGLTALWWTTLK